MTYTFDLVLDTEEPQDWERMQRLLFDSLYRAGYPVAAVTGIAMGDDEYENEDGNHSWTTVTS